MRSLGTQAVPRGTRGRKKGVSNKHNGKVVSEANKPIDEFGMTSTSEAGAGTASELAVTRRGGSKAQASVGGMPTTLSDDQLMSMVHAPSAFDEVRCELRAQGSTPKLERSALRTTGKVSIAVLRKFLHARLNLSTSHAVVLRCSGEDLIDAMTLEQLGTHVWPKSSGHIVLEYRIVGVVDEEEQVSST